ncbi:uncharacterized protein LOC110576161, partial [Neomonachus schauinslandi]|uniref:Uncharacterized protein LOC110576161 n=1 Tax=Neomonachus schauinslandi TaxID=29088 RepID=A0A8M1MXL1_NEOSC
GQPGGSALRAGADPGAGFGALGAGGAGGGGAAEPPVASHAPPSPRPPPASAFASSSFAPARPATTSGRSPGTRSPASGRLGTGMKDRLEQLKAKRLTQDDDADEVEIAIDNTAFMDEFFAEIEETRQNIDKISEHVEEAKKLYSIILSAPIPEPSTVLIWTHLEELVKESCPG